MPKYDSIKFSDMDVGPEYVVIGIHSLWALETKNPEPTYRAYSMANHPAEGNIIMLNIRIASLRITVLPTRLRRLIPESIHHISA